MVPFPLPRSPHAPSDLNRGRTAPFSQGSSPGTLKPTDSTGRRSRERTNECVNLALLSPNELRRQGMAAAVPNPQDGGWESPHSGTPTLEEHCRGGVYGPALLATTCVQTSDPTRKVSVAVVQFSHSLSRGAR